MLKIRPEERPDTTRIKRHIFFKVIWNPFSGDQCNSLQRSNPFEETKNLDLLTENDFSCSDIEPLNNYFEASEEDKNKGMLCIFLYFTNPLMHDYPILS